FSDSDLVRCHRKFLININKVEVLAAEKEGYYLTLESSKIDRIPVSKTYEAAVLARFNSR
ncbi:MAG: LytTR family transcriptional regulator, partial [Bacteroidales bacterium]|nr:LytTR family transcriptional regulator [Bacteroidales bacterium]